MSETNETPKVERKVYAIACRPDLYRIISDEAQSRGISRSALVRLAVRTLLGSDAPKKETRNELG
jgi:hypothetical protein